MKDLIEVFNMEQIPATKRAAIIIKLGTAINYQYAANVTEPIVFELVSLLDPENPILKEKSYRGY